MAKRKKEKYKHDLQNTTQKNKLIILSNLNPTKILGKLSRSGRVSSSCSTSVTRRVTDSYKPITNTAWVHARPCKLQKGCTRLAVASDKVYQLLAHGRWFSPGIPASEILLKVALSTKNQIKSINRVTV